MTLSDLAIACFNYFDTGFTTYDVQHGSNEAYTPTGQPYVRISVLPVQTEQISMGTTARYRNLGLLSFDVFVPKNSGPLLSFSIEDSIDLLFRRKTLGSIVFGRGIRTEVGVTGQYFQVNVTYYMHDYSLVAAI